MTKIKNENTFFTEASLTDSVLYKSFNNNAELLKTVLKAIKNSIVIDSSYIQEQLMQIKRTRISPLSEKVLESFEDGNIVILYANDMKIPQAMPFFATRIHDNIKVFIFTNNYGSISKSTLNSDEKYLNITMKDLYVLMEGAYVSYNYAINPEKVTRTLGLRKISMQIYTNMFLRILNKEYAISMHQELYAKVSFIIANFFLKYVWMSNNDEVNFSYALNTISSSTTINRAEYLDISEYMVTNEIDNISKLIDYLRILDPRLKGLNFRYFAQCYINMFKPPAIFGLECLPYFLFTVETSMIGSFIVNQPIISDITKNVKGMNTFYPELAKAVL